MTKKNDTITFHPGKFITPSGTARWVHLAEPRKDERFGGVNYECTIEFNPQDDDFKAMKKSIDAAIKDLCKGIGKPVPQQVSWFKETQGGRIAISMKRAVRDGKDKPIPVLDTDKQPCEEPWGGDDIRIAFNLGLWKTAMGYGVKPYPIAVQVLKRNKGVKNVADVFDDIATSESSTDIPF